MTPALLLTIVSVVFCFAGEARFFRIVGPVSTGISRLSANGGITWTNLQTNATFTIQTATTLSGVSEWLDYISVPANEAETTHRLFDPNAPAGMAFVPAGMFLMGGTFPGEGGTNEIALHAVYVSACYIDKYEISRQLWGEVYEWATNHGYDFGSAPGSFDTAKGKANNHPAQQVTWYGAAKWCNARSEKEGRVPAYYTDAAQSTVYRAGRVDLQNDWVNWTAGYRLPTEAEWEKAGRGGVAGRRFSWHDTDVINFDRANYYCDHDGTYDMGSGGNHPAFSTSTTLPFTSPVGFFPANGYGIHDMTGNVYEWCWDWYVGGYSVDPQSDPHGPVLGSGRIYRGGSWASPARYGRVAFRVGVAPHAAEADLGFRCVLSATGEQDNP